MLPRWAMLRLSLSLFKCSLGPRVRKPPITTRQALLASACMAHRLRLPPGRMWSGRTPAMLLKRRALGMGAWKVRHVRPSRQGSWC